MNTSREPQAMTTIQRGKAQPFKSNIDHSSNTMIAGTGGSFKGISSRQGNITVNAPLLNVEDRSLQSYLQGFLKSQEGGQPSGLLSKMFADTQVQELRNNPVLDDLSFEMQP